MAELENDSEESKERKSRPRYDQYHALLDDLRRAVREHVRSQLADGEEPDEIRISLQNQAGFPYQIRVALPRGETRNVEPSTAITQVVAAIASLLNDYPPELWDQLEVTLSTVLGFDHAQIELD